MNFIFLFPKIEALLALQITGGFSWLFHNILSYFCFSPAKFYAFGNAAIQGY
jgi:hypothetical protein